MFTDDFLFEVGRAKKRHLAVITGFGYTLPLSSSDRPPLQALTDVLRQGLVQIEEDALQVLQQSETICSIRKLFSILC